MLLKTTQVLTLEHALDKEREYNTKRNNTTRYSTVQYNTLQQKALHYNTTQVLTLDTRSMKSVVALSAAHEQRVSGIDYNPNKPNTLLTSGAMALLYLCLKIIDRGVSIDRAGDSEERTPTAPTSPTCYLLPQPAHRALAGCVVKRSVAPPRDRGGS